MPAAPSETVAITGASGLIGSRLVPYLEESGIRVMRLVRREPRGDDEVFWDPANGPGDLSPLEGTAGVVHLAGESVAGLWTAGRRRRIRESRVRGTRLLSEALASLGRPPRVLVSASGSNYYGDRGDDPVTEDAPSGHGFLAEVTREWEAASRPAEEAGIRVVRGRFGMVLSGEGGALSAMLPAFRAGLGGPMGSGKQFVSWISREDLVRAIEHMLATEALSGPVNCASPAPVTNREFARTLGRVLNRPTVVRVPGLVLRTLFGRMGHELLLQGVRLVPERLRESGFQFLHPSLEGALRAELGR